MWPLFLAVSTVAHVLLAEATPAPFVRRDNASVLFSDTFDNIAGWNRQGVIITKSLPWESDLMQDPAILYKVGDGPPFKMWYGSLTHIGYATSDDGLEWTKRPDPIISQTESTEKGALNQPSVVLRDGVWHMTYFGLGDDNKGRVLYASATDPGGPWTKGGPAVEPSEDWEDDYIYNSSLMYDNDEGIWKMWYTAGKIASAGGEPEFICYATAPEAKGPWTKSPKNPLLKPMNDGGWAHLGIGGPNARKLKDGTYDLVVLGWQDSYPSRGGRLRSPDGVSWNLDRSAMHHDLGVAGGVEDAMIYRQYLVDVDGVDWMYYNTKNQRPVAWIETINLAQWANDLPIIDPSKWSMTQGADVPNGATFEVRNGRAWSLGIAPPTHSQTLQGNRLIKARDYAVAAEIVSMDEPVISRDNIILTRFTDRGNYYYGGIASWSNKYAIGKLVNGANTKLAGIGNADEISAGTRYHLRLVAAGNKISLFDGNNLVVEATDSDLQPSTSYVGLQTTRGDGHATFDNVQVTTV